MRFTLEARRPVSFNARCPSGHVIVILPLSWITAPANSNAVGTRRCSALLTSARSSASRRCSAARYVLRLECVPTHFACPL
jgi:hypothetical protein